MNKIMFYAAVLAALSVSAVSSVQAQIPQIVSYQGYMSSSGSPYSGSIDASFTLFDAESGGRQAWSQQIYSIQVVQGYYSVIMDFGTYWQPPYWQFDHQYWLEVLVNNKALNPRVKFTASPYSMNARKADTATLAYSATHAVKADTAGVALKLVQDAPIGTIVAYAGQALNLTQEKQAGWYVCDGSSIPVVDYPAYASAIGSIYGTTSDGNGVYLPDFRGLFLRGVSGSRADSLKDPEATLRISSTNGGLAGNQVGSIQDDAMQGHFHQSVGITGSMGSTNWNAPLMGQAPVPADANGLFTSFAQTPVSDGVHGYPRTAMETRPKNAYVFWLIKVK